MAFKKSSVATIVFATIALCAVPSMAAKYQVGESAGWTSRGGVDYQGWASTKNFHAGDILVFNYNNQFHNVKQVTLQDFQSCNPTSPLATYNNGSDTVTVDKQGHYYFICGFPGHCLAGQKVHVSVTASPSPNPSPAPAPTPTPTPTPPTPTHSNSGFSSSSESPVISGLFWALAVSGLVGLLNFSFVV